MACGDPAPVATPGGLWAQAGCQPYADDPDLLGYCLASRVGKRQFGDPGVDQACGEAGPWEALCRTRWAVGKTKRTGTVDIAALLAVCTTEDCRFEVLDAWDDPDVSAQAARCIAHLPTYAEDCVGHALNRWWLDSPTLAQTQVLQQSKAFPRTVGLYLGYVAACHGIGECGGEPDVAAGCAEGLRRAEERPEICGETSARPNARSGRNPEGWVLDGPATEAP